jgi:hypothetical protein
LDGTFRSDALSQFLMMDQRSSVRRPSGHAEGEESKDRDDDDGGAPRADQRNDCRGARRAHDDQKTLRRLLVRTDCFLIDSFDLSDRISSRASCEEDGDRDECGEDHDGECGAQERRVTQDRGRKQQRSGEELAKNGSVIEDEVNVDGVGEMDVAHG